MSYNKAAKITRYNIEKKVFCLLGNFEDILTHDKFFRYHKYRNNSGLFILNLIRSRTISTLYSYEF